MQHIVLLDDSIFDNGVYVGREPDVATHPRQLVPAEWKVTPCAVDGDKTKGCRSAAAKCAGRREPPISFSWWK